MDAGSGSRIRTAAANAARLRADTGDPCNPSPSVSMTIELSHPPHPSRRRPRSVPNNGFALAVFGALLIVGIWLAAFERVGADRAEALEGEFVKNSNLVLALEVQTTQRIRNLDRFLLLMRHQHEHAPPRVPLGELVAPAFDDDPGITLIAVLDEHGSPVESLINPSVRNSADRPPFVRHQQSASRDLMVGEPVFGRASARWIITLSRRVDKPDGSFGGIVVISMQPSYLTSLFENAALGDMDLMSLVLDNGITLARRRGTTSSFGENISSSQIMTDFADQQIGRFIGPGGLDGHRRVFSFRRLADYPVIATVGTSEEAALAPSHARASTYYLVVTLVSLVIGLVCTAGIVLLTRQRRVNQRLVEQASLLDEAQDAILVSDADHQLTYWNRSAERLYGWRADEVLGREVADVLYQGNRAAVDAAFDAVEANGSWLGELQPVARDGHRVVTQSRWSLVRDGQGAPLSILAIDTDMTERRQMEQQFYRAQRLESIGTLAGGIAHDLNNVLTPIMLASEILHERADDDDSRDLLQQITDSAQRGARMVGQVLSFTRGQEGNRGDVPVKPLVDDVARIARDTLPKNIGVVTTVQPSLPVIRGDATQFHQVLVNLCVNARDAMPGGGRLTIAAETVTLPAPGEPLLPGVTAGTYVVLQVDDTGIGIPASELDRIFDPFFTTKEPGKGTGLGLSTSLAIVRSAGGHIRVRSEPGHGTRFRVYLPAQKGAVAAAASVVEPPRPRGEGETILVVDDEPEILAIIQQVLTAAGYRVLVAANGMAGLAEYGRHQAQIALVVTDVMMPVLGGDQFVRDLVRANPGVRVVAMSGIASNETTMRSLGPQVVGFLSKPFTSPSLLRAVSEVLSTASA